MIIRREQQSTLITVIAFFIIVFGLYLRINQYVANRSLWLDEASLALNIVNRSFVELAQPLDYNQGAPIGFLFLEKAIVQTLDAEDYILRLFPFIAGITAMFLMYNVTKRYIGLRGIPVALGLFAVSTSLVYYASEVKQYSSDVMFSLLLLLTAHKCIDENATLKHFIVLGFVGVLSLLMSHPALFVMVGIGYTISIDVYARKDSHRYLWLGSVLFVWLVSFVFLYFISLRSLAASENLLNYWSSGFMPRPLWRDIGWFHRVFSDMLRWPVGLPNIFISTILFFLGCFSLFARNWRAALILTIPFLTTLIASGFRKYPFQDRLLLFMVPIVILLVAQGLEQYYLMLRKYNSSIALITWIILAMLLMYKPVEAAFQNLITPNMREHIQPVIAHLRQNKLDTESIYVYYGAERAFQYYSPSYGFERSDYTVGIASKEEPEKYIQDIDKMNGRGRVWFLFSHNCWYCKVNEELYFLEHLDQVGVKIDEFESPGSAVYLYDLSQSEP